MCMNTSKLNSYHPLYSTVRRRQQTKRSSVLLHRLHRRRLSKQGKEKEKARMKTDMEMKNLKLYMENQTIIKENEKLRKKALLLHKENKSLLSQLQKLPHPPIFAPNHNKH